MQRVIGTAVVALCASTLASNAAIQAFTYESNGDVVSSYSGSLDTTGLTLTTNAQPRAFIANESTLVFGTSAYVFGSGALSAVIGDAGTPGDVTATISSGDPFGVSAFGGGQVALASDYVSESFISGSMTHTGTTLAGLGLSVGTIIYSLDNGDQVTWSIGEAPAPVPLPASLPLAVLGLGTLCWLRRRA